MKLVVSFCEVSMVLNVKLAARVRQEFSDEVGEWLYNAEVLCVTGPLFVVIVNGFYDHQRKSSLQRIFVSSSALFSLPFLECFHKIYETKII